MEVVFYMFLLKKCDISKYEFKITGYGEKEDDFSVDEDKYVKVGEIVYNYVKDNIKRYQMIYPKNIGYISIDKFKLVPIDSLDNFKNNVMVSYKKYFIDRIFDSEFYIVFINYVRLNNILSSKGFFITDENREDIYLEIINTEDEKLINILDEYLMNLDVISEYNYYMTKFNNFKYSIMDSYDNEEIKELFVIETGVDLSNFMDSLSL